MVSEKITIGGKIYLVPKLIALRRRWGESIDLEPYLAPADAPKCDNCGGLHLTSKCPMAGTTPEIERRKLVAGGCCGAPAKI